MTTSNKSSAFTILGNLSLRRALTIATVVLLLASLVTNIFLLRFYLENRTETVQLGEEKTAVELTKLQLKAEYYEAISHLNNMKGQSAEKDELIERQKADLDAKRAKIEQLIEENADAVIIQRERDRFRTDANKYLQENERLKNDIFEIKKAYVAFQEKAKNDSAAAITQIADAEARADENEAKALELERQKQDALEAYRRTQTQLEASKYLSVSGFEVKPMGKNILGKEKGKNKANKVNSLQITFVINPNKNISEGSHTFYFRILDKKLGTPVILKTVENETNPSEEAIPYAISFEEEFDGNSKNVRRAFPLNTDLQGGEYTCELYQNKNRIGDYPLNLK